MCQMFVYLFIFNFTHRLPIHPYSLPYYSLIPILIHVYAAKIHETKCMCYFGASPAASNLFSLTLDITNNAQR